MTPQSKMGSKEVLTQEVMQSYGFGLEHELDVEQLQVIHADLRLGGISKPQVCDTTYM